MKIFLTGMPGVGKTTIVERVAYTLKKEMRISGFITKEVREKGKRIGFQLIDIETNEHFLFASVNEKSNIKFGRYYLHLEPFERLIEKLKVVTYDLLIVDEIGKMEFCSAKFKQFIEDVLKSEADLLATLHRAFVSEFKNYGMIIEVTYENRDKLANEIIDMLKEGVQNEKRKRDIYN